MLDAKPFLNKNDTRVIAVMESFFRNRVKDRVGALDPLNRITKDSEKFAWG